MQASNGCLSLIKACEGFKPKPYYCPAGVPTIGYGSTRYTDNSPVKISDSPITEDQAEKILIFSIREYESAVSRYVKVPLNQNQFDALVDFAYNAGAQNLRTSTLLKLLNAGNYDAAATEFDK
jgi:lysozyme